MPFFSQLKHHKTKRNCITTKSFWQNLDNYSYKHHAKFHCFNFAQSWANLGWRWEADVKDFHQHCSKQRQPRISKQLFRTDIQTILKFVLFSITKRKNLRWHPNNTYYFFFFFFYWNLLQMNLFRKEFKVDWTFYKAQLQRELNICGIQTSVHFPSKNAYDYIITWWNERSSVRRIRF